MRRGFVGRGPVFTAGMHGAVAPNPDAGEERGSTTTGRPGYWPPPPARWSRLLRTTPLKLHRILGDTPTNLGEFFDEVRKVAQ